MPSGKKLPFVSIIVPFKKDYPWVRDCVRECRKLDYPKNKYEIILLPDVKINRNDFPDCKIIVTGVVNHSAKRNAGMRASKADLFAFIDSDAYPEKNWLKNAAKYADDKSIGAFGGPNLTPHNANLMERISGYVLANTIAAGNIAVRYRIDKTQEAPMVPSCNMFISRSAAEELKNEKGHLWDEKALAYEDQKICYELRDLGKRIMYVSDAVVYHHRREMFLPHMEQMWNYARDEASLMKERMKFDRVIVMMPALFTLWLAFGWLVPLLNALYLPTIFLYFIAIAVSSIAQSPAQSPLIFLGIFLTHIAYGLGFLRGLLLPKVEFSAEFRRITYNK